MLKTVSGNYLIDNQVLFEPATNRLTNKENQESLELKEPAARCLYMMLRNHANLISQSELMAYAWGDNHRQVPSNTFYQTILVLRKSLALLGAERDIIVTIPRKGLLIPEDIFVTFTPDNTESSIKNNGSEEVPELHPPSQYSLYPITTLSVQDDLWSKLKKLFYLNKWSVIFLVIAFINLLYLAIFLSPKSALHYFNDYEESSYHGANCRIFLNSQSEDRSRQIAFLKQHPELCQRKKYLYVTSYQNSSAISVFICTQSFTDDMPQTCIPYFYPDYIQEAAK